MRSIKQHQQRPPLFPSADPALAPPASGAPDTDVGGASGAAGADESKSNFTDTERLARLLVDRVGEKAEVSKNDLVKMLAMRERHGRKFLEAFDELHVGVQNPLAYVKAILEPEERKAKFLKGVKEAALKRGVISAGEAV